MQIFIQQTEPEINYISIKLLGDVDVPGTKTIFLAVRIQMFLTPRSAFLLIIQICLLA